MHVFGVLTSAIFCSRNTDMVLIFLGLILAVGQVLAFFVAGKVVITYLERKQAHFIDVLDGELQHLVKGEPCQSATLLNTLAFTLGREAGRSAKASIMADLAHISTSANLAQGEGQLALLTDGNPIAGQLLGKMGKRGAGKLMNNPFIQLLLQAFMSGGTRGNGDTHMAVDETAYAGRKHRD
jgi:hypothetical protein